MRKDRYFLDQSLGNHARAPLRYTQDSGRSTRAALSRRRQGLIFAETTPATPADLIVTVRARRRTNRWVTFFAGEMLGGRDASEHVLIRVEVSRFDSLSISCGA